MTVKQQAATALTHARAAGVGQCPTPTPRLHQRGRDRRPRTRVLITAHDPDHPATVLRFILETGNAGNGGGAYLVLGPRPGCSTDRRPCEVPMMSIAGLADLGLYQQDDTAPTPGDVITGGTSARGEVPIEFFGDPGHIADCPLR